jgi:hypothetical protein
MITYVEIKFHWKCHPPQKLLFQANLHGAQLPEILWPFPVLYGRHHRKNMSGSHFELQKEIRNILMCRHNHIVSLVHLKRLGPVVQLVAKF